MTVYLDNAATTRCHKSAAEYMMRLLMEDYGNPSSLHAMGVKAEEEVKTARKKIAKTLKAQEKEIVFTSGGTESNNLAILGGAQANRRAGNHIITTAIEHASVQQPMRYLEEQGFRVTYLPVDSHGILCHDALEEALDEDTILVSMILVNNEIGSITPVDEAVRQIRNRCKHALIHADAIQAYGKMRLNPKKSGIDLLSASGHKIHGPKGSGFLYIKDRTKLSPILLGGGQQKGMRSGTENVPVIAGLGEAAILAYENFDEKIDRMYKLREYFIQEASRMANVTINGRLDRESAPHIVSVSVEGVRSEVLLHSLEEKGIYISAGSACSSNKPSVSRTLEAIALRRDLLDSTVRFSFCEATTKEELDYTLNCMSKIIPFCRKFKRK